MCASHPAPVPHSYLAHAGREVPVLGTTQGVEPVRPRFQLEVSAGKVSRFIVVCSCGEDYHECGRKWGLGIWKEWTRWWGVRNEGGSRQHALDLVDSCFSDEPSIEILSGARVPRAQLCESDMAQAA